MNTTLKIKTPDDLDWDSPEYQERSVLNNVQWVIDHWFNNICREQVGGNTEVGIIKDFRDSYYVPTLAGASTEYRFTKSEVLEAVKHLRENGWSVRPLLKKRWFWTEVTAVELRRTRPEESISTSLEEWACL